MLCEIIAKLMSISLKVSFILLCFICKLTNKILNIIGTKSTDYFHYQLKKIKKNSLYNI